MMVADAPRCATLLVRPAHDDEVSALNALIVRSARALSRDHYSAEQIEAAIAHVFGVDTDLVADRTYLVAESEGQLLGCGGWSRRRTLFGGDSFAGRTPGFLDPAVDAARIRAFFVSPEAARRGIGAALLAACEKQVQEAGFTRTTLMATLPGEPFYRRNGYVSGEPLTQDCGGILVRFVPMSKAMLHF